MVQPQSREVHADDATGEPRQSRPSRRANRDDDAARLAKGSSGAARQPHFEPGHPGPEFVDPPGDLPDLEDYRSSVSSRQIPVGDDAQVTYAPPDQFTGPSFPPPDGVTPPTSVPQTRLAAPSPLPDQLTAPAFPPPNPLTQAAWVPPMPPGVPPRRRRSIPKLILGIVLTIIGGVGTLNMGSLTYDYIVVTSMGFITPSTLLPSLIFFDALALAALIGGVMIIFSSRPRPAQTTVTPIQRLRKRRTTSATSTSKRYSAQFRAEAVRMVVADQKTIAEVARNLAVSPSTLRRWVASQRSADSGHASSST